MTVSGTADTLVSKEELKNRSEKLLRSQRERQTVSFPYSSTPARNPGLNYGGHVNITEIGSFSLTAGLELHHWFRTTSTLLRRMNMQHAHVRCMVVVRTKVEHIRHTHSPSLYIPLPFV